ncbi:MAG: hypothetical protein KDC04_04595 [Saprospiraceae bacterium]|nr:hypothetical protein [Saprospiraceae bacterium]
MLYSCSGCQSHQVTHTSDTSPPDKVSEIGQAITQADTVQTPLSSEQSTYQQPEVHLQRKYLGKDVNLVLNPEHRGGEAWNSIWEEEVLDNYYDRMNRIIQLSPTVLLYERFPKEVAKDFYYISQPEILEFLDTAYQTIKTVNIWKDRPYQDLKNARLTYWNFDDEGMAVIPYSEQKSPVIPNEYSLFTYVQSEGEHVIVNYELRSIKNTKQYDMEASDVVAVKHTLHIYDLQGNLKYELKDLPSVDEAVVSNDGLYMMYVFGGMGLATANNPFGTIERPGWALMRLEDQKVVYQEYTDDGILAFGRLWKDTESDLLILTYSTPSTIIDYDRIIIFDQKSLEILIKNMPISERKVMSEYWKKNGNLNWRLHAKLFNFEQLKITQK